MPDAPANEVQQDQQVQPEPKAEEKEIQPQAPTAPDPVAEARRVAEEARLNAERWRQTASDVMEAFSSNIGSHPDAEEEEELDPKIAKAVEKRLEKMAGTFAKQYDRDRKEDITYRAELERDRAAQRLPDFGKYSSEVDAYMANVPVHLRATPGAYEEAYHVILGRERRRELEASARRGPTIVSSSRQSVPETPKVSTDDADWLSSRMGVTLSADEAEILSSRVVTIDDFRRAKR